MVYKQIHAGLERVQRVFLLKLHSALKKASPKLNYSCPFAIVWSVASTCAHTWSRNLQKVM
jgi:hypothetical protein